MAITELYNPTPTERLSTFHEVPSTGETLPVTEQLSSMLDFYKFTMSQFAYEREPNAQVTFTFKNRGEQVLKDYIDPTKLQNRFDTLAERGFTSQELQNLSRITDSVGKPRFSRSYLNYLAVHKLPPVQVGLDKDITITATGDWPLVTFWETIVMGEVSEQYFEGYIRANGIDINDLYSEGNRRLDEKIAFYQANPDIKFAEFGTRRRFSARWQQHVIERLKNECPENLLGTSNVGFAASEGLKPVGTFAHELPMVYAGLAEARGLSIRGSHGRVLDDWHAMYGKDLSIALPDTFGSDFFLEDFGRERAEKWNGTRHDSGDPIEYGEKVIAFYERNHIDPTTKIIMFSDGLSTSIVRKIHEQFKGRINHPFGIGTDWTNDLGLKAGNFVMKATHVNGAETVKLSDNPGKHTGSPEQIARYQNEFRP